MELFNVVVKRICPNGMEDVRAYNEMSMDFVVEMLNTIYPKETVTVSLFEDKCN